MEQQEPISKPETAELTEDVVGVDVPRLVVPLRRRSPMLGLMAMTALVAGCTLGFGGGPSGADIRNDPDRKKTDEDLNRMDAAQRKRERKAALRSRHNS